MITAELHKRVEEIAHSIGMEENAFVIKASISYLAEKKRAYLKERFEILSRYSAVSVLDLKKKISDGKVPEHPVWEDVIDIENIEAEVAEIDSDIRDLQKAPAASPAGIQ